MAEKRGISGFPTTPLNIGTIIDNPIKFTPPTDRERQKQTYLQRLVVAESEKQFQRDIKNPIFTANIRRALRKEIPPHVKNWILNNKALGETKTERIKALNEYINYITEGEKQLKIEQQNLKPHLGNVLSAIEHATSLKGDPSKQITKPNPLTFSVKDSSGNYKPIEARGSNDPWTQFIGNAYFNRHQGARDAFTVDQMDLLNKPKNWMESAVYYFGFNKNNQNQRLSHAEWLALQSNKISAEELFRGDQVLNQDVPQVIKDIQKQEERQSILNRYHPESTHPKKLSPAKRKAEEDTWFKKFRTIQLPSQVNEPTIADQERINILNKNPNIPKTHKVKTPFEYFKKIKDNLTSTGLAREAARISGSSPNPFVNIAGDFVGVIFDGVAYAANPKDKKALTELIMSGTQLGTSTIGGALMAIPDPLSTGLGYAIIRAGDNVGMVERLWNMQRESIDLATGKTQIKLGSNNKIIGVTSKDGRDITINRKGVKKVN